MKSEIQTQAQNLDRIVSLNLKKYRTKLGLSQREIAEVLGVSIQQIQKYEKSINRISSGKLYTLAASLDVPIISFFNAPS